MTIISRRYTLHHPSHPAPNQGRARSARDDPGDEEAVAANRNLPALPEEPEEGCAKIAVAWLPQPESLGNLTEMSACAIL